MLINVKLFHSYIQQQRTLWRKLL